MSSRQAKPGSKGRRIAPLRLNSAGYSADIPNDCKVAGQALAIDGRLDASPQHAIANAPDTAWHHYADGTVAETLHSMNKMHTSHLLCIGWFGSRICVSSFSVSDPAVMVAK